MKHKPLMICIHCGGIPFNGDTIPSGKSLGGSESAAYFMARELARIGHKVVVFTRHKEAGRWDDVIYDYCGEVSESAPLGDRFHYAMRVPWDVVIVQRHPLAFAAPVNAKLSIWWLHDLALHRMAPAVDKHLAFIDQVFTVSEFHRRQVASVYGISEEFITATWNGVDYDLFEPLRRRQPKRDRKSLVFASRPERGLEEIVAPGGIAELLPDFKFHICGYDNTTPDMAAYYRQLWARCDELPNVTNHGPLGKADLYRLLASCGACIYPTTFEDTSNILLLEANAAGTPFVGPKDHAALPETGAGGGFLQVPLKDGAVDRQAFADAIHSLCDNEFTWEDFHRRALSRRQTWASAAEQWTEEFYRLLREKSSDKLRLTKHLERMSDIVALCRLHGGDIDSVERMLPDFRKNYGFWLANEFKQHYDDYYAYEENRGVEYGPEDLTGNARFEHTFNVLSEAKPKTVLDYGCAHGHYTINLAKRMPGVKFLGVDIAESNIEKAEAWAKDDGVDDRVCFRCGDTMALGDDEKFDCILLCEVLEHVADPAGMVNELKRHLRNHGVMIITTPYGPWEAIGYEEHKGWRAHLHHFERWDLFDLFDKQPDFKLLAIPHSDTLGHYLCYFRAGGPPCGAIDYDRKLATQAPRETVSLCMIARDAEFTLGKTLQKVKPLVDEIRIVIDEKTQDDTAKVAERFGAIVSYGKSPLEIGFAEARNASIADAQCDWILWIDADEHFERVENVYRYLRRSPVMAIGVPQHHYSEEPAGILKSDFPARLFRNRRGIKFFGFVHEHPETAMNAGPGRVVLANDFGLMHFGYSTEAIRRKRFERNWPLMVRDNAENPDRVLGRMLWLRDLAHMCKYIRERTGGAVTPEVQRFAEQAVQVWDKVLESRNLRMIADALQYYSEAVMHLLNGNGIQYELDLKTQKGPISPTIPRMRGYFLNREHIAKFAEIVHDEATKLYDERYF